MAAFGHAGVRFEPDDGYAVVAFTTAAPVEDLELASRLVAVAGDGPTRAWLVARLAHLTELDPHLFGPAIEVEPDGLFVADLLATDEAGRVLAKLQLQASPHAAALLGVAGSEEGAARAGEAFVLALLAAPDELAEVEVHIEGPGGRFVVGRRAGKLIDGG